MIGKEQIITFAANKFTQFGSKRFSMDELAALLGISKKTIYKYFDSKEELVTASIEYLICEYNEAIENLINTEKDSITIIILMYQKAFERLVYFKPSFIFGLKKYYPSANKVFNDFRDNFVKVRIYNLLKTAEKKGILLDDVNLNLFCDLFFKRFEEIAFIHNNLFEEYPTKDLLNHFIVYSLRGITKPNYTNPFFK
ncbi:TetR/AcrR family transcriptional regulator [Tenacibaculum sp. IB213877]|uniref:TetR/AcrR family transcriptional regulator n=1 Tax=Tenacibaculum sp. IB213877 TaxID=3097351 RepID=UPI002A5A258C|nr:TetR/AcrR family transcriptional regulator [Tenacibaculum sp. IB213877]MDY0779825.1 TetR/AcrR family transcriptional regulator [Tenacibaculum sp. IB213877]